MYMKDDLYLFESTKLLSETIILTFATATPSGGLET